MEIRQYGNQLMRLEVGQIELLRTWRNYPEINRQMEFQEYITPDMQEKWFSEINTINNYFFLIKRIEEWIGLIHLSKCDFVKNTAEAGLFVSNPKFINSTYPILASLSLLNFGFSSLGIKSISAKVHKYNHVALDYNQQLGFSLIDKASKNDFIYLNINQESFLKNSQKWLEHGEKKYGRQMEINFDPAIPQDDKIKELLTKFSSE